MLAAGVAAACEAAADAAGDAGLGVAEPDEQATARSTVAADIAHQLRLCITPPAIRATQPLGLSFDSPWVIGASSASSVLTLAHPLPLLGDHAAASDRRCSACACLDLRWQYFNSRVGEGRLDER